MMLNPVLAHVPSEGSSSSAQATRILQDPWLVVHPNYIANEGDEMDANFD